jgi:hypothetical protein
MTSIGKYGPGIIGAEAFAAEQAKKASGADKFGPGVLGSAFTAESEHEAKPRRRRHAAHEASAEESAPAAE